MDQLDKVVPGFLEQVFVEYLACVWIIRPRCLFYTDAHCTEHRSVRNSQSFETTARHRDEVVGTLRYSSILE